MGAGPGDPSLLTLRARDLLASSDVVLYDHLVNPAVLQHTPPSAHLEYAGKVGHGAQHSQRDIEQRLIAFARRQRRVVRLKGGDPLLFGRGGEEALALSRAGVAYEIVPGVSSALAAPAYAGIPLTHRGIASSVAVVAGHCARECNRLHAVAAGADTVVALMGVANAGQIAHALMDAGRSVDTPAAAIEWATHGHQRVVTATLETLQEAIARNEVAAPAVIVVGEVVRLRDALAWFGEPRGRTRTFM